MGLFDSAKKLVLPTDSKTTELDTLLGFDSPLNEILQKEKPTMDKAVKTYALQSGSYYSYMISCYVIENWIKTQTQDFLLMGCKRGEFEYDYDKKCNVVNHGSISFIFNGKVFNCTLDSRVNTHTFSGSTPVFEVLEAVNHALRENNPLKRKHIQLVPGHGGFVGIFKAKPTISFDNLIVNDQMKEDIYDNTIFQLKHLKENNGIILHGAPGTGKSLACQAIVHEAINEGFSTCFLTTQVNYTMLNEFIERFLAPCIIIFEDMDSFGRSREEFENTGLADFLQFLSGLSENKNSMIFVGTTNYIGMLDEALTNRPVRFNRKFEFKLPSPPEVDRLIALYFKGEDISKEQRALCYDKKLTGSHFKEINRTCKILSLKRGKTINEVFSDAVALVKENFSL